MGWQDRDYNDGGRTPRMSYTGVPGMHPLLKIFMGALPLGRWFGINVRVHAMLVWWIALQLLMAGRIGWMNALASSTMLFTIVLLHEFGHCIGARMVGGRAEDILLWPLGGLATTETDRQPWARFVTVICGPLVNVIICVALGAWMWLQWGALPPMNPLFTFMPILVDAKLYVVRDHPVGLWVWWAYVTSWSLLLFNLLPIYPLDGGKLLQIALWKPLGYFKSINISCIIGMVGAVILGLDGLIAPALFLVFLAVFGFMDCFNTRRLAKYEATLDDGLDLSAAWEEPTSPRALKRRHGLWAKRAAKKAAQDQAEQAKIDAILAKVKEKGLHSLSWFEKRALKKATERQRQRDLAER